jgi:nitrile hydratase
MSDDHDHDHDGHHHPQPKSHLEMRAGALEALLAEKGLVSTDAVDAVVSLYENDVGPQNGAKVVARAWVDPAFKAELLANGTAAVNSMGFSGFELNTLVVVENTPTLHNVIVCTLCSCHYGTNGAALTPRGDEEGTLCPRTQ